MPLLLTTSRTHFLGNLYNDRATLEELQSQFPGNNVVNGKTVARTSWHESTGDTAAGLSIKLVSGYSVSDKRVACAPSPIHSPLDTTFPRSI